MTEANTPNAAPDTAAPVEPTTPSGEEGLDKAALEAAAKGVFGETPAPAAEPDKAPPPAVEPPKPAEDDKIAARVAAAKKAEIRAAREREAIAAQKAELEKAQAELADAKKMAEAVKAAKLSPSKVLELLELQPKDFLERLATENEPGSIAAREVAKESEERAKLKAELDELKAQIATEKRQIQQAKNAERAHAAETAFVEHVEKNAAKYPHLVEEFTPEETVREGYRVLDEVVGHDDRGRPVTRNQAYKAEHGTEPTDDEIAEYLESLAEKRAQIRQERRARMGLGATQTPSQGNPTGDLKTAQPDRGQSPRTLTSRAASERATVPKPWSQEAADEESIRIIEAALRKQA